MYLGALLLAAMFVVAGQTLFKLAALRIAGEIGPDGIVLFVRQAVTSPLLWAGCGAAACGMMFYVYSLQGLDLSRATPIATGTIIVFTVVVSARILDEPIGSLRLLGLLAIVGGTILVGRY